MRGGNGEVPEWFAELQRKPKLTMRCTHFWQSDEVVMQITLLCQHKKIFHSQYYLLFELNCFGHKSTVVPLLATKLK